MTTVDLSAVKKQLEDSAKNFAVISSDLTKYNKGPVSDLIPEIGQLNNAIPAAIASLSRAAKSIGSTIIGVSSSSAPAMENVVKALVPDMSGVKDLADKASTKLKSTPGISNLALEQTCTKASVEATKVESTSKTATDSITAENQRGPKQVPQMISEINSIGKTLSDYTNSLGSYLFNPATAAPTILDTKANIKSDQLLENAIANKDSAVDTSSGAVSAAVYKAASMIREINSRFSSKANMYDRALSELSVQTEQANADAGKSVSQLRGTTPRQQEGI